MRLSLSPADLAHLDRTMRLLLSPLTFPSLDRWRSAVNASLVTLVGADSVAFLLPVSGIAPMYSDEHAPENLAAYAEVPPPTLADGTSVFQRGIDLGVCRIADAYGPDIRRYLRSAYYNEFAAPNGACDTMAASLSLGGADPRSVSMLQCWHSRPRGRRFGDREIAMLRLLFPAFHAGVASVVQWHQQRGNLADALDRLNAAALVCDSDGSVLHQTPALTAMLAGEPLRDALRATMGGLASTLRASSLLYATVPATSVFGGDLARYVVRGTIVGDASRPSAPLVVVTAERNTPAPRSDAELRAECGLTPAELRVMRLLAKGMRNVDIARTLGTSPHTARRHTERVLAKLGVASRAEVGARIVR